MSKKITLLAVFLISFVFFSCSNLSKSGNYQDLSDRTELGTTDSIFLNQTYIYESLDFALYNAWIKLDDALQSGGSEVKISLAQKEFLDELENEKHIKSYKIENSMFGIQNQLADMEKACRNKDAQELSRLVTAFYISKALIYQKSGNIFMQMIILMGALILLVLALLFFYQLTYARRIEIEKILKATNKGQEEERRRIALELHDSVAQQMRYVSILAEKIDDDKLAKEIKTNQSECIENIRNTCYTLSSINMDKGNFPQALKNAIDNYQKRTKIETSLVITADADFDSLPQITFHHLFRIIMELLANIEKHSEAGEVTILIRNPSAADKMHKGLMVFISDDGNGIEPKLLEQMNSKKITSIKNLHFGLQNIKLRLNEIGGSIKFVSEEGEGTEVEIRIGK
jgi:C4-dicarboxylate-specific signal transduction histidine kinase